MTKTSTSSQVASPGQRLPRAKAAPGNRVETAGAALVRAATATVKTRSLAYLRLYLRARKRGVPRAGQFRFPFGTIEYTDVYSMAAQYFEIFVQEAYAASDLPRSPRIIDGGANVGLATVFFLSRYPGARVTAFEADPAIATVLQQNLSRPGLGGAEVVAAALGREAGTCSFATDGGMGGHITEGNGCEVPMVRLSSYIDEPVDLLKLDIEGGEFDVLDELCASGAIEGVRRIVMEVHAPASNSAGVARLWSLLARCGFHAAVRWAEPWRGPTGDRPTAFPWFLGEKNGSLMHVYAWQVDAE